MTIKEIREKSGMTRAEFSRTYNIPARSLENWESGKTKCPPYLVEMLWRIVTEDQQVDYIECYDPEILREMGYCYKGLLYVLNPDGHNPWPMAETLPTKFLTIAYMKAVSIGIPDELNFKILHLMNAVDDEDWSRLMDTVVPTAKRQYFILGELDYKNEGGK